MVSYAKNSQVDDYIQNLPDWQQNMYQKVRDLVHSADAGVEEVIKRRVQPYFVLEGNICAFLAAKDHINIFIYDPIAPDTEEIINQGHGNLTARSIQLYEGDTIHEAALVNLFKAVIANNRAGGWRKVKND
jgi:hypothetical protein